MIDHKTIQNDKFYQCMHCHAISYGYQLDWFWDEPELTFCPVCGNRCGFIDIDEEVRYVLDQRVPTSDEADMYMEMDAMNE
jgi:uncharacterized protein (DUF169 family)